MRHRTILILLCASGTAVGACTGSATTRSRSVHVESEAASHRTRALARTDDREAASAESPSRAQLVRPAGVPAADAQARVRVHYALAPELARAELRRGETALFDFGEPGDAKYHLGGWQTLQIDSEPVRDGDARALAVRGKSAKLFLAADAAGPARVTVRVRSFKSTALSLVVGGKKVGEQKLGGDRFETVGFDLAAGVLRAGDNTIELKVSRRGSPSFALDYIAIAPGGTRRGATELPPPRAAELAPAPDTLHVPAGISLGYTLEVPDGAELTATARSAGPARLRVTAARDGTARTELATLELDGSKDVRVRVPLTKLERDLARVELSASGAGVTLHKPVIVEPTTRRAQAPKPIQNVVVMLIDTLRADKLAPYNPETRVRTPGLVRFLEDAVTMYDTRTQENWTKPSVATLLSSLYPWQHNAFDGDSRVPESVELLPEYFRGRGYRTAAFIANGYVSDKFGFGQGWDDYRNYIRENRRSIAQEVAGDVLTWLDERPQSKPFFLYVHTIDPHVPYRPPKNLLALYDPLPYRGPVDFARSGTLLESIKIGKLKLNERDKVRLRALYDAEITYHDVHFAAIFDGLDKRGLRDDTMVVITADHGEEFWEHGSVGHGHSVYDELLRIPLIVRIPGVTEDNAVLRGDVGLVDIAPTILDAMKLPIPAAMAGQSFLPELLGGGARAPRATASGFMTSHRTLAVGRYKLIQQGLEATLYDLQEDPLETNDVARTRPIALRYTRGLLGLQLASHTTPARNATKKRVHKREKTEIDAETEAQLKALGYVGTSRR